jgi:hypothetical protein
LRDGRTGSLPYDPLVPEGTQCLDYPIFPALKRWAIFQRTQTPNTTMYLQEFSTEHYQ